MKKIILLTLLLLSSTSIASPKFASNKGLGDITKEMWKVILTKPWSLPWIKKSANLADLHSQKFCDVVDEPRHTRDEVDAVRHFMLASLLASKLGANFTRKFLTAHEQRTDSYNDENIMDLKNNELGIKFSPQLKKLKDEMKLSKIESELILRIKAGKLFVLTTERSNCTNSDKFPNM